MEVPLILKYIICLIKAKNIIVFFFCLVTKAVHIEVVTDLSADVFLVNLKRFVSRRGLCKNTYSDCATNFVDAKNALQMLFEFPWITTFSKVFCTTGHNFSL